MTRYVILPTLLLVLGAGAALTLGLPLKICLLAGLLALIGYVVGRAGTIYMVVQGGTSGPSWLEKAGGRLYYVLPAMLALGGWWLAV